MDFSRKKALEMSTKAALVVAVLVALTCFSGSEASAKEQATPTSTKKSLGSMLKGIDAVPLETSSSNAFGASASYTRFRNINCKFRPSICAIGLFPGSACCGVACVDLHSHPGHCGTCNHICRLGHACCSGKCKRLSSDRNHCGSCNNKCASGSQCAYGLCGY